MEVLCKCGITPRVLTVKKEGPNTGREFYSCNNCNFFKWKTPRYNPKIFKAGTCYRCGRWGCASPKGTYEFSGTRDAVECKEEKDFFGNEIPEDWANYN